MAPAVLRDQLASSIGLRRKRRFLGFAGASGGFSANLSWARCTSSFFAIILSLWVTALFSLQLGKADLGTLVISWMTPFSVVSRPHCLRLMLGSLSGPDPETCVFSSLFGVGATPIGAAAWSEETEVPVDAADPEGALWLAGSANVLATLSCERPSGGASVFSAFRHEPAAAGAVLIREVD